MTIGNALPPRVVNEAAYREGKRTLGTVLTWSDGRRTAQGCEDEGARARLLRLDALAQLARRKD